MDNQDNKVYEVFVTDGDKKKSVYLDSYKVTIAVSVLFVVLFIFGIIWLASSSAENSLIKNKKNESSGGSLFHSGGAGDNFQNSVAGASTRSKNNSPIFISTPPGNIAKPSKALPNTPPPEPTATPEPHENNDDNNDNDDNGDDPEPTATPTETPTPTNTPEPTATPTETPTPTDNPTPKVQENN